MIDFLNALQSGIDSAINKEKNFLEIHNIFLLVKEQITVFSNGTLDTQLLSMPNPSNLFSTPINYFHNQSELYTDKKLQISPIDANVTYLLTKIYFDRDNGYPCTITINGDEYTSINKESLEENIQRLLSSSAVGSILYRLIKEAP